MRILKRWLLAEYLTSIRHLSWAEKTKLLWMKGWTEAPIAMVSCGLGLAGTVLCTYMIVQLLRTGGRPKRYYRNITIFRPDDPRAGKVEISGIMGDWVD